MDTAAYVAIGLSVLVAAGVQGTTGFGFALLSVPLMSLFIEPEQAVVISASLGLLASAVQAWSERHHGDRPTIIRMLIGAAIGSPFGLLVFVVASPSQLRFILAGVIIVFLILNLRGLTLKQGGRTVDLGAGAISGVLNTSLSTNGPPLVMALHARHLPPQQFRGTLAAVFAGSGLLTVLLFAGAGKYSADIGLALVISLPTLAIGYLLAARFRQRIRPDHFRNIVTWLLFATAVLATLSAFRG
ncbi:COG0730 Predicted permeases [Acidimicrobiia bacterium]